jgi:hypothetical protein
LWEKFGRASKPEAQAKERLGAQSPSLALQASIARFPERKRRAQLQNLRFGLVCQHSKSWGGPKSVLEVHKFTSLPRLPGPHSRLVVLTTALRDVQDAGSFFLIPNSRAGHRLSDPADEKSARRTSPAQLLL